MPHQICYLCGAALKPPINNDHVPPRQLYVKEIRIAHSPTNLLTLPTHTSCNSSYQLDEDYFVNTLAPLCRGTYAGDALLRDVFDKYSRGEKQSLVHKVLQEFDRTPSGLQLPPSLIAKRIEGARVHRVAWKIVRGLYYHELGIYLPESTPNQFSIVPPNTPPPEPFPSVLAGQESRGAYPSVFDYKFVIAQELQGFSYWGFLLWDSLIFTMAFHGSQCHCDQCYHIKAARSDTTSKDT